MCSCTSCTARALGCRAGRLLGLLLGVRGLCAPKFGRNTTGTRVGLLLLGPDSGSSRFSPSCFPPSGLALLADSVSLSGAALAGSALPQSTSSCWPSLSAAWVAVAVASFAVGCGVSPASAAASALPPSSGPTSSSARVGMAVAPLAVGCGVFLAASVLPPRCCLAFAFVFVLGFRVFPAWLLVVGLPVLAFIFRRMRRAFARRPLISCGNRII